MAKLHAIQRSQLQLVVDAVRRIDDVANVVDADPGASLDDVMPSLLAKLCEVTSAPSAFAEIVGSRWVSDGAAHAWQEQHWRYMAGVYGEALGKLHDAGYGQVERFRVPWEKEAGEIILLPIHFDAMGRDLGYVALQSQHFEVGVEKGLAFVEDIVLDNLIHRLTERSRK